MSQAKIFTPVAIGPVELKNRLAMAPMMHNMAINYYVSEPLLANYERIAQGGWGMICVEGALVSREPHCRTFPGGLLICDPEFAFPLSRLAETIKSYDTKVMLQIGHPGRVSTLWSTMIDGLKVMCCSETAPGASFLGFVGRTITKDEIKKVVTQHAFAAKMAEDCGFDGICLHFANVTLPMDFMSPYMNDRTDEYGRNWDGRLRFPCEIIQAVKSAVSKECAVYPRIPADQFMSDIVGDVGKKGLTIDDVVEQVVPRLEEAGADAIDISAGILDYAPWGIAPSMYLPRGVFLHYIDRIKKVARVPVIGVGRLNDPKILMKVIEDGRCDIVACGRAPVADPDLPRKMTEGRFEDIRRCVGCNTCLVSNFRGRGMKCAVNPECCRELTLPPLKPAEKPKKVLIVGGGPAGLEAARILGERGHRVTLCEKEKELGGQLRLASAKPLTREWRIFIDWLSVQAQKVGVMIETETEVTEEYVGKMNPDAIVVATGSSPSRPDIPGVDKPMVVVEDDALLGKVKVGKKVIIIGGKCWGAEMAVSLADEGKEVTLLEESLGMFAGIGGDFEIFGRGMHIQLLLAQRNVKAFAGVKVREITDKGVKFLDKDGKDQFIEAETVITTERRIPHRKLFNALKGKVSEIYEIGDCVTTKHTTFGVAQAVYEGTLVGRKI